MRFATYREQPAPRPRAGVVSDAGVHPLPPDVTVLDLVRAGLPAALAAGAARARRTGRARRPRSGCCRRWPRRRSGTSSPSRSTSRASSPASATAPGVVPEWYQAPTFYFTNPYALIGAHDDVPVPPGSELLDFELEVAVVVGRDGASLTPEQAREHIFGYTILNDWSARDLQRREMKVQPRPGQGQGLRHHPRALAGHRRRARALPGRRRLPRPRHARCRSTAS